MFDGVEHDRSFAAEGCGEFFDRNGLFLEKYPHLEMVSFGPTMRGVHSPDERLEIASVDKFWRLLREVVTAVARE